MSDEQLYLDIEGAHGEFVPGSIYSDWVRHAEMHKWYESEKQRRDLGEPALLDWVQKYWGKFVRWRLMEHLEGKRFWSEFDGRYFAVFRRLASMEPLLADRIADRLRVGGENLCVTCWAEDWGIPKDRVQRILGEIDLNRHRLDWPIDPTSH